MTETPRTQGASDAEGTTGGTARVIGDGALRLLVLASRPSDYAEMSELARALAKRGHQLFVIYFYAQSDPGREATIGSVELLAQTPGVSVQTVDVDAVQNGLEHTGDHRMRRSQTAEIGVYRLVIAMRDRVLGRDVALMLRRRFPTVRRAFPIVYRVARVVDLVSNWRPGLKLGWRSSRGWPFAARARLLLTGPKVLADAAFMDHVYGRFLQFFRDTIAAAKPTALLIPEDIVGNTWPVAIKAGHEAGVPTLVFPYTLANKEEAFQSLKDEPAYQTRRNQLAAKLYPRWRLLEDGIDLVRLPSAHIFAHERLDMAPPDPWMMNSGFADAICVDSQASFDYFRAGGIPADRIHIVGSVSQDQMFARRQHREDHRSLLRKELQLSDVKPILLISGCPNQLAAQVPFCEFKTIAELAEHVGDSIASLRAHYHVIVRPHPNFPEFGTLLQRFGFAVTMAPTASLVPLADVFVAFASATIRWAIGCAIPTVNYDVFHYRYADFANVPGVVSVSDTGEFRELMRTLTPASPALQDLARKARHGSSDWSFMDGQGILRIEEQIQRTCREAPANRHA